MTASEYRCPNCLKQGLTGIRFGVEIVGLPYLHGLLWPDTSETHQRIFCLKCLADGIEGIRCKPGLVAERNESGWEVLTLDGTSEQRYGPDNRQADEPDRGA